MYNYSFLRRLQSKNIIQVIWLNSWSQKSQSDTCLAEDFFFFLTYGCFSKFLNLLSCASERKTFFFKDLSNDSDIPRLFEWIISTK